MAAAVARRALHSSTKRMKHRRRLKSLRLLHGKVEVRSKEEGFLGSWHQGIVVSRKGVGFTAKFHVKYDHLLLDDYSDRVVEAVPVSLLVAPKGKPRTARGCIRPLPPLMKLSKWGLPFGLCVDVNHNDGWWEGVIFDYNDGAKERRVFFPDLGDEMVVSISAMRITQDWDEVSEEWNRRGMWIFLELIEEYNDESGPQLPVSIKQIWYDLQVKEGIRDWTCLSRAVWEELVSEAIRGSFGDVLNHLFDEVSFLQLSELAESVNLSSDKLSKENCEFVPIEDLNEEQSASLASTDSLNTSLDESNLNCEAGANSEGPESECLPESNGLAIVSHLSNGSTSSGGNIKYALLPVVLDKDQKAKCCPKAIVKFAKGHKEWATAAKQHLLYLKWSIQFYKDPKGATRRRYVSPSGKRYDSLPNACRGLIKSKGKKDPHLVSEHDERITLHDEALLELRRDDHGTPPHALQARSCTQISIKRPNCLKAILDCYKVARKGEGKKNHKVIKSAKDHLAAMGWTIEAITHNGKSQWSYKSPRGRVYSSLRKACKSCMDERDKSVASETDRLLRKTTSWIKGGRKETTHKVTTCFKSLPREEEAVGDLNEERSTSLASNDSSYTSLDKSNLHSEARANSEGPVSRCLPESNGLAIASHLSSKAEISTGSTSVKKNRIYDLLPVELDNVYEAKCCPEAIVHLAQGRGHGEWAKAAKQHLLYLKWSIKFYKDPKGATRTRYLSPSGKCYDSLPNACRGLMNSEGKNPHSVSEFEEQISLQDEALLEPPRDDHGTPPHALRARSCTHMSIKRPYFLEAIMDCYKVTCKGEGRKNPTVIKSAKDHLAAMGWTIEVIKHKGKSQYLYKSPGGCTYGSLLKACKSCIDERDKSVASETDRLPRKTTSWIKRGRKETVHKVKTCYKSLPHKKEADLELAISRKEVKKILEHTPSYNSPVTTLSWLLDNNAILPNAEVYYSTSKDNSSVAKGKLTREGIECRCCGKVFSLSSFELHVGRKNSRNCLGPASCVFLADGRSLLDCQVKLMGRKARTLAVHPKRLKVRHESENDDVCSVCRSGGDLILCDKCPSSFHSSCLGMKDVPKGDWFCRSCCCRICKQNKVIKDSVSSADEGVHKCTECEFSYHIACLRNSGEDNVYFDHQENWFCGKSCRKIYDNFSALLGIPIPIGVDDLTWTLLKRVNSDGKESAASSGIEAKAQSYMKLDIALHVMHECFEPLKEFLTGRDIVNDVIFSERSELRRLDFGGFYTVLLEKDDEVVSVATLRTFGETAAEVPFVATRHKHRGRGMCQILMSAIEEKLAVLGIKRLVLPAAPTVLNTWTGSFGFSKMTESQRLQLVDTFFLNFPGAIMCHKLLTCTESTPLEKEIPTKTCVNGEEMELKLHRSSGLVSEVVQAEETGSKAETNCSLGSMKRKSYGGCGHLLKYYYKRKIRREV